MLEIVDLATVDAVDPSRIDQMGFVERSAQPSPHTPHYIGSQYAFILELSCLTASPCCRYFTASALLMSSWALGIGSPTFLTGALLALLAHLDDTMALVVNCIYVFAGVYIIMATGFMVMGALPQNLAQHGGMGSTYIRDALGGGPFLNAHAVNDMLAGTWMFTGFMVACVIFAAADLAMEPSMLAVWFLLSQIPFGTGFVVLARASYPESINVASIFDAQGVIDEMVFAGHQEVDAPTTEKRQSFYK